MGRKAGESSGAGPGAAVPWESLSRWNLDAEALVPENKSPPPGRDSATGGKRSRIPTWKFQQSSSCWSSVSQSSCPREHRIVNEGSSSCGVTL
ncbi:protein FAM217A isoform X3 [Ovis canadensis]|uniref:protein FAM217A isoform X3 n=1 Tax=Ovis canadensis TaxID=37174 RepID=UPI003752183B